MSTLKRALVALLCIAGGFAMPVARAETSSALTQFLTTTQRFRADFVQTVHSRNGKKPQTSSGVLMLSRPGKFRWQVDKPYAQLIVGDGRKVWMYDPDLAQVTVRTMAETLAGTPAAILAGNITAESLDKDFAISPLPERDGLAWTEARPRAGDAGFERVRFGFRGDVLSVMEMHDHFGQVTVVQFSGSVRNPTLPESSFRFVPPAGVDVVGD